MPEQEMHDNRLTPLEVALAGLAPTVDHFDRERVIFLAGQAAALRGERDAFSHRWGWRVAFSAMTAVAATLLAMLVMRTEPGGVPSPGNTNIAAQPSAPRDALAVSRDAGNSSASHSADDLDSLPDNLASGSSPWILLRRPNLPAEENGGYTKSFAVAHAGAIEPSNRTAVSEGPRPYYQLLNELQGESARTMLQ